MFTHNENDWLSSMVMPELEKSCPDDIPDPPLCEKCHSQGLLFFDPTCLNCNDILCDPSTTIAEIFAIMRQWVPQTQQNIDLLVLELFKRGFNINERDTSTDLNLLHYVAKSGAPGIGDISVSLKTAKMLIEKGIHVNAKCRWTDMSALHYSVFFDVYNMVQLLLQTDNFSGIDQRCKEFDDGTALHVGCQNLSLKSVQLLVKYGANPHFLDMNQKRPIDCIPEGECLNGDKEMIKTAALLRNEVTFAMKNVQPNMKQNLSNKILQSLGLRLHDQVVVAGKIGILRYAGSTQFSSGQWGGIEFEKAVGKNDGSVGDVRYFQCEPAHGIFAPITKVKRYNPDHMTFSLPPSPEPEPREMPPQPENTALFGLKLGEKVLVAGQKSGYVRYRGPTKFASGTWVGIELEDAAGKNDGSVGDFQYFTCDPDHGVFAPLSKVQRICDAMKEDPTAELPKTVKSFRERQKKEKDAGIDTKKIFMKDDSKDNLKNNDEPKEIENDSLEEKKTDEPKRKGANINRRILDSVENLSQPKKTQERLDKTFGAQVNFTLKESMSVYVNNEIGIVRFIGRVEFADGIWLGVELRKPNGKNDGAVQDKRYFTCKPDYGLMVRPARASCRGINCEQLVDLKFR